MVLISNFNVKDLIIGIGQLKTDLGQGSFKLPFGNVELSHADSEIPPYCRLEIFGPRRSSIVSGQDNNLFCPGWEIKVTENLPSANLFAMASGAIRFESISIENNITKRIILFLGDFLSNILIREINSLPDWFPIPKYIIYENIDEEAVRSAILDHLNNNEKIKNQVIKQIQEAIEDENYNGNVSELVEIFITKQVSSIGRNLTDPLWIEVNAGTPLGKMGRNSTANERNIIIKFLENDTDTLLLNPSYYFFLINNAGMIHDDIEQHPFKNKLLNPIDTIASNGTIRFVKQDGIDQQGSLVNSYLSPSNAAKTIISAISSAQEGDYILILDNNTYEENEIVISKPISICGLNQLPNGSLLSEYLGTVNFPILSGSNSHRVIRLENIPNGITHIGHISVENGIDGDFGGGGIFINGYNGTTNRIHITNCFLKNNRATGGDSAFVHGFGGGILVYHSSPIIFGSKIENNKSNGRGGGIGVYGYGWPSLIRNYISNNETRKINPNKGSRPDGGGIAIVTAVPKYQTNQEARDSRDITWPLPHWDMNKVEVAKSKITHLVENIIKNNYAADDGGGVYISIMSNVLMHKNEISENFSVNNGGGVRFTFGSTIEMFQDKVFSNKCNWNKDSGRPESNEDNTMPGGGGISVRNANLLINEVEIWDNLCPGWSGGGIYFISSDAGTTALGPIDVPWMPVMHQIFETDEIKLSIISSSIHNNRATHLDGQESDHGKGGGVYIFRISKEDLNPDSDPDYAVFKIRIDIGPRSSIADDNEGSFPSSNRFFLDDPDANILLNDLSFSSGTDDFNYINDQEG